MRNLIEASYLHLKKYLTGRSHGLVYWLIGLLGTPIFVGLVIILGSKIQELAYELQHFKPSWLSIPVVFTANVGALCFFYLFVYVGTTNKAMNSVGVTRASMIIGLLGHFSVTVIILSLLRMD